MVFSLGIYFWRFSSTEETCSLVSSPILSEFVFRMDFHMFDVVLETNRLFSELLPLDDPRSEIRKRIR
jgi:hypothetical protein